MVTLAEKLLADEWLIFRLYFWLSQFILTCDAGRSTVRIHLTTDLVYRHCVVLAMKWWLKIMVEMIFISCSVSLYSRLVYILWVELFMTNVFRLFHEFYKKGGNHVRVQFELNRK